jgi:hypothetical protein
VIRTEHTFRAIDRLAEEPLRFFVLVQVMQDLREAAQREQRDGMVAPLYAFADRDRLLEHVASVGVTSLVAQVRREVVHRRDRVGVVGTRDPAASRHDLTAQLLGLAQAALIAEHAGQVGPGRQGRQGHRPWL